MTSFAELRALATWEMEEAAWHAYYPAMAAYLTDADPEVRKGAVDHLSQAVLYMEASAERQARREGRGWAPMQEGRLDWLLEALEIAHARFDDIIPVFVKSLSVRSDEWLLMKPLRAWLGALLDNAAPGVAPDKVEAALLRMESFDQDSHEDKARLIALLDHPSNAVRACAAHHLSNFAIDDLTLFDLIKQKEWVRPGLAGPFWMEFHMDSRHRPIDPIPWMMEILEGRAGPEPSLDEMGYNGIDFYLHEVCDGSPETIRRMIDGGYVELAIETACEMRCEMPGMAAILIELGHHADGHIAKRAWLQLAMYYRVLHPAIGDGSIRHWVRWATDAEVFSVHHGVNNALWFIVLYPRTEPEFDDAKAWAHIDRALPPDLRGPLVRHVLDWNEDEPPAALDMPTSRLIQFASGANLMLEGDVQTGRWHRIEIGGAKLGDGWTPFAGMRPSADEAGKS